MKYLKEYSQFGGDLYEPISYDEYIEFISSKSDWGKPLEFTNVEVNSIKSVLGSEVKFQLLTNGPLSNNPKGELITVSGGYYGGFWGKKASWSVTITKYDDEWFMGQSEKVLDRKTGTKESKLWKCDTIDGVIQLIRDTSSSVVNESNSTDEWYYEIPKVEMERIPSGDFIDIDSRVLGGVQSGLTEYISKNCPRISVRLTRNNWIGLNSEAIMIDGFNYYQSGFEKGKWHPHQTIKWMRKVKISQLKDEWFLVGITASDYSMYFKCDQIDGLMRLLEDYYICEKKMVKESVEEDKEILSDYFIEFEDKGGKVFVKYDSLMNLYHVDILTSEARIKEKINWKRISQNFDIVEFQQRNTNRSTDWKRTFMISFCKKGERPRFSPDVKMRDETMKKLKLNESNVEKLAKKISLSEWNKFEQTHTGLNPTESDYKIYKEFMLDNFTLEEVKNFQNVDFNFGFEWECEWVELNDEGEEINLGYITIYKFDDEWWVVEKMVKGWHKELTYWLVDTKEGFKDIKLWD